MFSPERSLWGLSLTERKGRSFAEHEGTVSLRPGLYMSSMWALELTRTASFCAEKLKGKEYSSGLPRWSIFIMLSSLFLYTALRRDHLYLNKTKTKFPGSETNTWKLYHRYSHSIGFFLFLNLGINLSSVKAPNTSSDSTGVPGMDFPAQSWPLPPRYFHHTWNYGF